MIELRQGGRDCIVHAGRKRADFPQVILARADTPMGAGS